MSSTRSTSAWGALVFYYLTQIDWRVVYGEKVKWAVERASKFQGMMHSRRVEIRAKTRAEKAGDK